MDKSFNIFYDNEADVLYIIKGHPDYIDFVEYNDNIILRFHPESKELVGFTITDFSLLFAKQDMDLHLPFKVNFEIDKSLFVSE